MRERTDSSGILVWLLLGLGALFHACAPDGGRQAPAADEGTAYRTLTDMRGVAVRLPATIDRVVTISDGFVAGLMLALGEADKIVGVGSRCVQLDFRYEYLTESGDSYAYENGLNTVTYLHPRLRELPLIAASNSALNYEALAGLRPDVVILRAGCCTFGPPEAEQTAKAVQTIEQLGIPVLLLKGPPSYEAPTLDFIGEEIRLLGRLFGKEERAERLAALLDEQTTMIRARTAGVAEEDKPGVLMLGLSPRVRAAGGAGNTKGSDTIESYLIDSVANARNAYQGRGGRAASLVLSAEQIYALDPDVIVLPTASGYHPPRELYSAPYFRTLQRLRAVEQRRVYALPWTPCNCAKRIEYPIEALIIAKAAYPEKFADIAVHDWVLDFYRALYGVDEATAEALRSAQWLDWTLEEDF